MNRVVIAIGSNIRPRKNIPAAVKMIAQRRRLITKSKFVSTVPIGPRGPRPDQPQFINGAVLIETRMSRAALKRWLRGIEAALGRVRTADKFAPRTIDLDIVVWNGRTVSPDVRARPFLRKAIAEILPEST